MVKLKKFSDVFVDGKELLQSLKDNFGENEMFVGNNWFLDNEKIWDVVWNIYNGKSYSKYFIWNDNVGELQANITGVFIPMLWREVFKIYIKQLPLIKKDLIDLADWKNRGNIENGDKNKEETNKIKVENKQEQSSKEESAENRGSVKGKSGYKWDNTIDAPTEKEIIEGTSELTNTGNQDGTKTGSEVYNINKSNRFNEIMKILNSKLELYLTNMFYKFEFMFIDINTVNRLLGIK